MTTKARDIANLVRDTSGATPEYNLDLVTQVGNEVGSQFSRRNLLINGAMNINQRTDVNTATAVAAPTSVGLFNQDYAGPDRFVHINGVISGGMQVEQSTNAPNGFSHSIRTECTTAKAALAAGDRAYMEQILEGQDVQHLAFGTDSAQTLTLSFWVRSNLTGTFTVEFDTHPSSGVVDYHRSANYTIDTADTWEKKTITIEGNKASAGAIPNNNGRGFVVRMWLAGGSGNSNGTQQTTSWATRTVGNAISSSHENFFSSTSNYIEFTGMQLETGDEDTDFEHLPYEESLRHCKRYYEVQEYGYLSLQAIYSQVSNTDATRMLLSSVNFKVTKRAAPTIGESRLRLRSGNMQARWVIPGHSPYGDDYTGPVSPRASDDNDTSIATASIRWPGYQGTSANTVPTNGAVYAWEGTATIVADAEIESQ